MSGHKHVHCYLILAPVIELDAVILSGEHLTL
jgi:hypothetical protein